MSQSQLYILTAVCTIALVLPALATLVPITPIFTAISLGGLFSSIVAFLVISSNDNNLASLQQSLSAVSSVPEIDEGAAKAKVLG